MVDGTSRADGCELLPRIARGDREAFAAFARRWERPLFRFLLRRTGSPTTAEDARQVTLVRVFRRAGTYRGGSVAVWVFRIAHRVAIDLGRREGRRPATAGPRGAASKGDGRCSATNARTGAASTP